MREEQHRKIVEFLMGEFSKRESRQCVKLEVMYSQNGYRDEPLRSWLRVEDAERFDDITRIEQTASEIMEICEAHADGFGIGKHRFLIRATEHLGGRSTHTLTIYPQFTGDDEVALTAGGRAAQRTGNGDADAMGVLLQTSSMLARNNTQMFQGTVGVLAQTNRQLLEENTSLRTRVRELEKNLDGASSTQLEKEFDIVQKTKKMEQRDAGFGKLMQLSTILVARLAGTSPTDPNKPSGMHLMVLEFGRSLRNEQFPKLFEILDMPQRALLMEILQAAIPPDGNAPPPPQPAPSPMAAIAAAVTGGA